MESIILYGTDGRPWRVVPRFAISYSTNHIVNGLNKADRFFKLVKALDDVFRDPPRRWTKHIIALANAIVSMI